MEGQINYKNITIKPSAYTDDFNFKNFLNEYQKNLNGLNNKQMIEERNYRSSLMLKFPTTVNVRMNLLAREEMIKRGLEKDYKNLNTNQREI